MPDPLATTRLYLAAIEENGWTRQEGGADGSPKVLTRNGQRLVYQSHYARDFRLCIRNATLNGRPVRGLDGLMAVLTSPVGAEVR